MVIGIAGCEVIIAVVEAKQPYGVTVSVYNVKLGHKLPSFLIVNLL